MVRFADGEAGAARDGEADRADEAGLPNSSDIRVAWRLDRKSGRIAAVDRHDLRCQSPGD
jgi:hypothetical protein